MSKKPKTRTQFSIYIEQDELTYLRAKSARNRTSISSELRAIVRADMAADEVRGEVDRCLR